MLQRLDRIADAAPGLGSTSRVMDIGSGPGTLIPHLQVTHDSCADFGPDCLAAQGYRKQADGVAV